MNAPPQLMPAEQTLAAEHVWRWASCASGSRGLVCVCVGRRAAATFQEGL